MMRGQSLSEWLRDLVVTATQARKREPRNVRMARTLGLDRARGA